MRKIRAALKGEFLIFLVFVIVSACLWLMFVLRKQQETSIYLKANYRNIPNEYVITNNLPHVVEVKVKDVGFNLLMYKLFSDSFFVSFDFKDKFDSTKTSFSLFLAGVNQQVAAKLSPSAMIKDILPKVVVVRYEKMHVKQLPVVLNADLRLSPQYMLQGVEQIQPQMVNAYGPKSVLERLTVVNTQRIYRKNLSKSVRFRALLQNVDNVKFVPSMVDVSIPVEQFTEKALNIPVVVKSVPKNIKVKVFPAMVEVSFIVGLSYFEAVTAKDFEAYVDYSELVSSGAQKLNVHVIPKSVYVSRPLLFPRKVDYIIERIGD